MAFNVRIVSTYPPRKCGIGTFSRDLATALEHFPKEVKRIRVAAIDRGNHRYDIPVDTKIDQYDPESWRDGTNEICLRANSSSSPTVVLLQHEYGLDPDEDGNECRGRNFVHMARTLQKKGLIVLVYLHTVLEDPDDHQKRTIQELARHSDGLIVTTESAIQILESKIYGIPHVKLKHIDHGIRMQHPSQFDRLSIKKDYGLEDRFLMTTLGLLSPGKGIQYAIRALGRFLDESCDEQQRKRIVYIVGGKCHPDFVTAEGGRYYREYKEELDKAIAESGVTWHRVKDLADADPSRNDVIFLDTFLDEATLMNLYGATNVMVLPYLNTEQISSGILADTLGAGRVAVTTKFRYALELIHSNRRCKPDINIGRYARGILVDPGEPSVDQIAQALDYLVFNEDKRLVMEKQAHQRGYQMRWYNSAWALLQYVYFVRDLKEIVTGRGPKFERTKDSSLQLKSGRMARSMETVGVQKKIKKPLTT